MALERLHLKQHAQSEPGPTKSTRTKALQGLVVFLVMFVVLYVVLNRLTGTAGSS